MAAKKKPTSAADFRKAEEASKKKPSTQTTATYKGQKVDWKTPTPVSGSTVGPRSGALTPARPIVQELQNTARSIAVGGPIIKSVLGKIAGGTAPKVIGSGLAGRGTYTTPSPSVANSYSSIRGMNVSGKTVLQEDLGAPIAIGAILSKKKKKK